MATAMVLTVAQTLFSALQTNELRERCSMFGHESQLADLEDTVKTIKGVLLDADSKHQELSNQGKDWVGKLKDAIYDADDLLDEINTVVQQQGDTLYEKVCRLFSGRNQLFYAASTSRKIKKLRKKLDSIAKDHSQFGLGEMYEPIKRREDSISYVYESSIIGREADKEDILGLLLGDSDVQDVSIVSIVGIGGLGKTALAQIVFHDDKIKTAFELKLWVCVSEEFSMKEILLKMLGKSIDNRTVEELHKEVREMIEGKRYFIVLDDVWEENHKAWDEFKSFMPSGARGSRILVTTRSKIVARATGDDPMYELKGLSDEDSWCLFEKIAFNQGSRLADDALVEIGKDILKKCANVPLSIKVIASMLFDQDISVWRSYQSSGFSLAKMGQVEDDIMATLKFSYYHLTQRLKTCFSYCALFPKDYIIRKEFLINLWIAEGCLEHLNDMQDMEDVGEQFFKILLQRCFFQDIQRDENGKIFAFKIHDLIHDLATHVAGKELCLVMDTNSSKFNKKIRHASFIVWLPDLPHPSDTFRKLRKMRTLLQPFNRVRLLPMEFEVDTIFVNCKRLRVLDLNNLHFSNSSSTIGNLSHLRYLDLSNCRLRMLPKALCKLYNLQILNLHGCYLLEELPADLKELVNLRQLDTNGCRSLTCMPAGMGSLIGLRKLTMFVVGEGSSNQVQKGQLSELIPLINLRGELKIKFKRYYPFDAAGTVEGAYLVDKKCLEALTIVEEVDKRVLECLQPHSGLRRIDIKAYTSIQLPGWAAALVTSLPLLVSICLWHFQELQHLPQLSQLRHLKILDVRDMPNVEYMEDDYIASPFFPSLEILIMCDFPKLRRWWRSEVGVVERGAAFSRVVEVVVRDCPHLTSFPGCLNVKNLRLWNSKEAMTFCREGEEASQSQTPPTAFSSSSSTLLSSSINMPSGVTSSNISSNDVKYLDLLEINNMGVMNAVFAERYSSIQRLCISYCNELKSLTGVGIHHLTNLQSLTLIWCVNLELEEEEDGMPWKALHKLIYLELQILLKVKNLPKGIQHLSSLRQLKTEGCDFSEAPPEWLHHLTSLEKLEINGSRLRSLPEAIGRMPSLTFLRLAYCHPELEKRCQKPDGEDWPKVRNIPNLFIGE